MRIKGIGWMELHLEKVVLVVVAAIFLAVVALQFLWQPNAIKVANKSEPVPPGSAFEPAKERAAALRAAMETTKTDDLPRVAEVEVVKHFEASRVASVSPSPKIAPLGPAPQIGGGSGEVHAFQTAAIAEPKIPAPAGLSALAYRNAIDPTEVIAHPELAKILPPKQPFDAVGVSVQATFDGTALRAALASDPDGAGPARAIPQTWWNGNTEALGVVLQRQELLAGGKWSDPVEVASVPGRGQVLARARAAKPAEAGDLVALARAQANDALRPPYLRTIAGPSWSPPVEALKSVEGGNPAADKLLRQLADQNKTIERIRKQLDDLQNQPAGGGERGAPGEGGGGGRGGRGAPPPPQSQPSTPQADPKEQQRTMLNKRLKDAQDATAKLKEQIRATGAKVPGEEQPAPAEGAEKADKPLLDNGSVKIWAHDITASPGKVYRYRMQLAVTNPAFGRGASLPKEQEALANRGVLLSEASEWTQPAEIPADRYVFLTSASPSDAIGPARAGVEVYQFFYGYYRKASLSLEAGDQVIAEGPSGPKLPDRARLPIWDMKRLAETNVGLGLPPPGGELQPPDGRQPPPLSNRNGRGGGGGKGGVGGPADGGAPPPPAPPAGTPAKPLLPEGATPYSDPLEVRLPMYLLDVRNESGKPVGIFGNGGAIETRAIDEDRGSVLYRALIKSAKDGETQGFVPPPPPEAQKQPPFPPSRRPGEGQPDARPPAGGGGGGAGGG